MKHIYKNIDGWFSFAGLYEDMVKKFPSGLFVEVGCYKGCSFSYMVIEVMNSGKKIDCVAVDLATDQDFINNMAPLEGNFRTILGTDSVDAARQFKDNSIDFCFLDGNHYYLDFLADIQAYLPKMKKGGVIAGHDYNLSHPGVINAVNEMFIETPARGYYKPEDKMEITKPGNGITYIKDQDIWIVQL